MDIGFGGERRGLGPKQLVAAVVAVACLSAACGGNADAAGEARPASNVTTAAPGTTTTQGATVAPTEDTTTTTTTTTTTAAPIELEGVEACTLLDVATLQSLTGTSGGFSTDSYDSGHCFWGSTAPGVPQYVELQLSLRPEYRGLSFDEGCSEATAVSPEMRAGDISEFFSCLQSGQTKSYLVAFERGVQVELKVNEAPPHTTAEGLAQVVHWVFSQL